MGYIRLLTEIGVGIDLMGRDVLESIHKAIEDIVHRVCIPYFRDKALDFRDSKLVIDVYTPYPARVDRSKIIDILPVKTKEIVVNVYKGGASIKSLDEIIVSIVAITILIPENS